MVRTLKRSIRRIKKYRPTYQYNIICNKKNGKTKWNSIYKKW